MRRFFSRFHPLQRQSSQYYLQRALFSDASAGSSNHQSFTGDVNDICRVLSDYRGPQHDLESALSSYSGKISSDLVDQVLKRCKHLGLSSHRFFLWASRLQGFNHRAISYHILVDVLGSCKEFPLIWDLLWEMRDGGLEIRKEVFRIIFRSYCRAGLPADTVRAFKKMKEFGVKPDIDDFHHFLTNLCHNGFMKEAQEAFENWKSDFTISPKTYCILMKGWGDQGKPDEAQKLFDDMLNNSTPDAIAYNTLMGCLCRSGKVTEAYEWFREMKQQGFQHDAASYGVFIRAACDSNDAHSAFKVLDRMRRYGLVPNVFTYNSILQLLCKSDQIDEAYNLLDEMLDRGSKPDAWSYNVVLSFHCRRQEVNSSLKLLSRMDKDACLPDKHTYNMLLRMLINVGRSDRAMEVWDGMQVRAFHPPVATYAVMIHGLCRKKNGIEMACKFFERMVDEGLPPYLSTCELVRNTLLRLGLRDRVCVLKMKMRQSTSCAIKDLSHAMSYER
ncbi:pentatricopeptide repeat (PPR) superfamily protein [Wolffia australiana]